MNRLREICSSIVKHTNIHIVGVPGREERERRIKLMVEHVPNLLENNNVHMQEA